MDSDARRRARHLQRLPACRAGAAPVRGAIAAVGLAVLLAAAAGCRVHPLADGRYRFDLEAATEDPCQLFASVVWPMEGTLRTAGDTVSLELPVLGATAPPLRLLGAYRSGSEALALDGSLLGTVLRLGGVDCRLESGTVHLDGQALDAAHLTGSVEATLRAPSQDVCNCRSSAIVRGARLSD